MAKTKGGQRKPANLTESAALTVNERTLQECHRLYVDEERGGWPGGGGGEGGRGGTVVACARDSKWAWLTVTAHGIIRVRQKYLPITCRATCADEYSS